MKAAPPNHRLTNGCKEVRTDPIELCIIVIVRTRLGPSRDENTIGPLVSIEGAIHRKPDILHSGDGRKLHFERLMQCRELLRPVSRSQWIQMQYIPVGRLQAEVLMLHVLQTLRQ